MGKLRVFIVLLAFFLVVMGLVANSVNAIENNSVQSAFFAGILFWVIIDYAFKAMVLDKIRGDQ